MISTKTRNATLCARVSVEHRAEPHDAGGTQLRARHRHGIRVGGFEHFTIISQTLINHLNLN